MNVLARKVRNNYGALVLYSDAPLPLNELLRMAGGKAKRVHGDKSFIRFVDVHFFERYGVYCLVYVLPDASVLGAKENRQD